MLFLVFAFSAEDGLTYTSPFASTCACRESEGTGNSCASEALSTDRSVRFLGDR